MGCVQSATQLLPILNRLKTGKQVVDLRSGLSSFGQQSFANIVGDLSSIQSCNRLPVPEALISATRRSRTERFIRFQCRNPILAECSHPQYRPAVNQCVACDLGPNTPCGTPEPNGTACREQRWHRRGFETYPELGVAPIIFVSARDAS